VSTKVLVADDSDVMRTAIVKFLSEESSIELVGEARGFAQTIELANALKPDVLLMDLHMGDEREYPPESVRAQLSASVCLLAVSIWNDEKAKALAERFGAQALLDKANLYSELIPTIKSKCTDAPGLASRIESVSPLLRLPSKRGPIASSNGITRDISCVESTE
jgi:DNA-binding NarL/FixJ family response regulator